MTVEDPASQRLAARRSAVAELQRIRAERPKRERLSAAAVAKAAKNREDARVAFESAHVAWIEALGKHSLDVAATDALENRHLGTLRTTVSDELIELATVSRRVASDARMSFASRSFVPREDAEGREIVRAPAQHFNNAEGIEGTLAVCREVDREIDRLTYAAVEPDPAEIARLRDRLAD